MPLSQCIQCIQCIYIYIHTKAVKATWERIKACRVHINFHWVEQLIGNNQWLKILISELEYVDMWITCVLIHCFTGGSHCPGWCGPEEHPSLPGSRIPVLRILTVDEKFGLGYSDARNIEHIEIKEHLIKIIPKLIIDHLSRTISIASNGRIPGFFHCINSQRRLTNRDARVCGWGVPGHQLPKWHWLVAWLCLWGCVLCWLTLPCVD